MAYTPKQWVCGETITADGLNNIEEGIQEALDCCGSGGDCGYSCAESQETVFEGNLTTSSMGQMNGAIFTPSETIEGDSIVVTIDGVEYDLPKADISFDGWGEFNGNVPNFTNYPCAVFGGDGQGQCLFATPSIGTYSVKIEKSNSSVEVSECFEKAVEKASSSLKYVADAGDNGAVVENSVLGATVIYEGYEHVIDEYSANQASGDFSHAEGQKTKATNVASHAEGYETTASGSGSHAEGSETTASGEGSHAEGLGATASGYFSHAEGYHSVASGSYSHAQGNRAVASGGNTHASGVGTIAQGTEQTVIGSYNVAQGTNGNKLATDYAFIIGNGDGNDDRSNAFAVKWDGTFVFANGTEITPAQFASLLALL